MADLHRSLIRFPTVKWRVGKGRTSIYEDIKKGSFPKLIPIGARSVTRDSEAID